MKSYAKELMVWMHGIAASPVKPTKSGIWVVGYRLQIFGHIVFNLQMIFSKDLLVAQSGKSTNKTK